MYIRVLSMTFPLDRLLFLYYCFSNCLFYALIKLNHNKFPNLETLEIIGYINVLSFLTILPYYFVRFRLVNKLFNANKKMILTVPSSFLKIFCIGHISPKNALVVSFMTPGLVTLLSFLILDEYDKKHKASYLWLLVSFLGVIVFAGPNFREYSLIYSLLFLHVFLRALVNIVMKKISKEETGQNRFTTLFYMLLFYTIASLFIMLGYYQRFSWQWLFSKEILILSLLSASCQLAQIKSYELAEKISLLQNLDYSRIVFGFLLSYIIFDEVIKLNELAGVAIVLTSVLCSFRKSQDYLRSKIFGLFKKKL